MPDVSTDIPTYSEMLAEYLATEKAWIGTAELPLVHHLRKLCEQLDAEGLDKAAMSSTYLQTLERLDKRRPRPTRPADNPSADPAQSDIFDFLD